MTSNIDLLLQKFITEDNFIEKAHILKELKDNYGLRIIDLSQKTGVKPAYICHILRLNQLPEMVIDGFYSSMISISHLFVLSRINDMDKSQKLYEEVLQHNYTVIQLENRVREVLYEINHKGNYLSNTKEYEEKIAKRYSNSKIKITQTRIKSKLNIEIIGNLSDSGKTLKEILKKLVNE